MFIGEYSYKIDKKRRVSIPAKFRKKLGNKVVITRWLENCLVLYPMKGWKNFTEDRLAKLDDLQIDARGFSRILLSGATDVSFDKLGRILIPDYLTEYASLKKDVTIIGLSNKIEIWDTKKWNKYRKETEQELGDIASKLKKIDNAQKRS
jgi:MraZ protein